MQPLGRIALLLIASIEFAAIPTAASAQEPPKIQAGGGFLYIARPSAFDGSQPHPDAAAGWFGKVVGNITPRLGAEAEVSGSYNDAYGYKGAQGTSRTYGVLGGARVRPFCCRTIAPFAHVIAGIVHSRFRGQPQTSERSFALAFGGGLDVRGFHVATDLVRNSDFSAWTWRIATGVMLPGR